MAQGINLWEGKYFGSFVFCSGQNGSESRLKVSVAVAIFRALCQSLPEFVQRKSSVNRSNFGMQGFAHFDLESVHDDGWPNPKSLSIVGSREGCAVESGHDMGAQPPHLE